jgi:hypothetical protein
MTSDATVGTLELLMLIFNEEGIQGLFRGGSVRMMYMCVGGFVYFGIYEHINKTMTRIIVGDKTVKSD